MSILKRGCSIPIGEKVVSIAVGCKPEFVGTVTGHLRGAYHVADEDGNGWHRDPREIKPFREERK